MILEGIIMDYQKEIKQILKKIKGEWFEEEKNLITDGHISSFELIKLIKELENGFGNKIPLEKIEPDQFNSIESIAEFIRAIKN